MTCANFFHPLPCSPPIDAANKQTAYERQRPGATGEESVESPGKASYNGCEGCVHPLCPFLDVFMTGVGVAPGLTERRWEAAE